MPRTSHPTSSPHPSPSCPDLKGDRGQLQHRCGFCAKTGVKLSRCSACHAIRYCSREHQVEHRSQHKSSCGKIKKLRTTLDREDHAVRNATPDFMTPANAFETHVGHFWGLLDTRDYMRARFALADTLRQQATLDGVSEALDHLQDMLRLNRSDNMGLRDLVPAVMLQLDKDQECYDFVKWWVTVGRQGDYDWGNMDLPFLNVKDANVMEDVKYLKYEFVDVQHVAAVMLLNMKLLVDVVNIKLTRLVLKGRLPPELWGSIESNVVRSPISHEWVAKSEHHLTSLQETLQVHVKILAKTIMDINENFAQVLLNADEHLSEPLEAYSRGTFEEMVLMVKHSYPAWRQHEGVLELLRSAKLIAGKDSEDEIDDMMEGSCFKTNPGSDRSRAELLDDVSRNRLWGYFDDAVEDAVSLNKIRPSDKKREELRAWVAAQLAEEEADDSEGSDVYSDSG